MNRSLQPADALDALPWVSPRELKALHAAGLASVGDVLMRMPRRYEDRRRSGDVASVQNGDTVCLQVHVYSAGWRFSYKRYYELSVGPEDEPHGARILLRWFNMPYVAKLLAVGMNLFIYGRVREYGGKLIMVNPDFEQMEEEDAGNRLVAAAMGDAVSPSAEVPGLQALIHTGRIVPIYRGISGMPPRNYRSLVWKLLEQLPPQLSPAGYDVAPKYPYREALNDIHFPAEDELQRKARMRFALQECFAQQFRVAWRRRRAQQSGGMVTATDDAYVQELLTALPFELTAAQQRCIAEVRADMASTRRMNRLLQGDVGSGKTLVALCAMLYCIGSGYTAALIAPTQILAEQHYRNFCRLLAHTDIRVSLRTSGRADDTGNLQLDNPAEADRTPRLLVGTHALLYKKNRPQNLGLAVVDEQHKFGVEQRERFISSAGTEPDVLVMTATPIPRTLTLTLYGDLDVSVIDELPAGRGEIVTALRNPAHMKRIITFMESELKAGRQIYIVSPLVEESEKRAHAAATTELERWRAIFPDEPIGLLHGRIQGDEKEAVMADFRDNKTHILVATTVVEVGVDVPNATIMLINDADSFGLSQLHQLRGRIGRGSHKSYCILLSKLKKGDERLDKLNVLCRTNNGFEIAEEDFKLRGPGDVLGTAQSGLGAVQFPEWLADLRLIHRATRDANAILDADPTLSRPEHAPLRELVQNEDDTAVTG